MKLKRNFPLIVLLLLSCILLAALPVADFLRSDYPNDLIQKIQVSLKQGLIAAGAILLFVWIGVGINALLARIKDASVRRWVSLATVLGSFLLCIVVPLLSLFFVYGIFSAGEGWQQLPAPPETSKAIAAGGHNIVVIETEAGNYFHCSLLQLQICWQPENKPNTRIIQSDDYTRTTESNNKPGGRAPGKIISLLGVDYQIGPDNTETYFAVLDNRTVWYVRREQGIAGFATGLMSIMILPVLFVGTMFLMGLGAASLLRWLAARIWKETETAG